MTIAAAARSASTASALRVLWIESGHASSASGLVWLRRRMQQFVFAQRPVTLIDHPWPGADGSAAHRSLAAQRDLRRLTERIDSGVERIVVACVNRLDYPVELIEFLQHSCPEVPLAVAGDSWFDGRRRTGLPTPGHLSLAWYRWWDGWVDWLQGRSPALFEVAPAQWPVLSSPASVAANLEAAADVSAAADGPAAAASSTAAASRRGLIVGNCRQTTAAWALAASAAGHASECISRGQFQQHFPTRWSHAPPQWVLWDDSCLDTVPVECDLRAPADEAAMRNFFESLAGTPRNVLGIVAVSMPRAAWAIRQCASPGRELLVKPSGGAGLARLLS